MSSFVVRKWLYIMEKHGQAVMWWVYSDCVCMYLYMWGLMMNPAKALDSTVIDGDYQQASMSCIGSKWPCRWSVGSSNGWVQERPRRLTSQWFSTSKDWIRNYSILCASRLSGKGSSDAGKSSGKSGSFFGGGGYALRHRKTKEIDILIHVLWANYMDLSRGPLNSGLVSESSPKSA